MDDFSAFSSGERVFLEALNRHGVRFMLVGLSAAVLQGANTATRDIDIWFEDLLDPRIGDAAREGSDRLDVVAHMHGLGPFLEEFSNAIAIDVDGIPLHVLALPRIIASKCAANRTRDLAAIPALEEALAAISEAGGQANR